MKLLVSAYSSGTSYDTVRGVPVMIPWGCALYDTLVRGALLTNYEFMIPSHRVFVTLASCGIILYNDSRFMKLMKLCKILDPLACVIGYLAGLV